MTEGTDLGGVPVELDGAVRLEVGFQQSPIGFQDSDSAATIVVGTLQGRGSETRRRGLTYAERRLPGAGRNGHILVLVGHVSIINVWGIRWGVPVLMSRNDDDLVWRSGTVDGGDLRVDSVKAVCSLPDCQCVRVNSDSRCEGTL